MAFGVGRLALAGGVLYAGRSVGAATIGLALAACLPTAVAWWGVRRLYPGAAGEPVTGTPWRELWRNAHLLLGFFALTNLDVLLARSLFTEHLSGLYAAGAILAKACLFLPQFVIIVAFPRMARTASGQDSARAWLLPLAMVGAIGGVVVLGTLVLRDWAVAFVGGSAYAGLSDFVWWFALEGTLFALLQMAVYRQIAHQSHRSVWWLWAAVGTLLAAGWLLPLTPRLLLAGVVGLTTACLVALLSSEFRRRPSLV